jgi:hypothetical protein
MKPNFKLFIILVGLLAVGFSYRPFQVITDFEAYYLAGQRIWAKTLNREAELPGMLTKADKFKPQDSIYQRGDNRPWKYSPSLTYVFLPFSLLPFWWAQFAYYWFALGLFMLTLYLIYKQFKDDYFTNEKYTFIFFGSLFLLQFRFNILDILNLQVNFLMIFCTVGFLFFRKTRENLSAFLLALLVGIKIFPVFFLAFLLKDKNYRLLFKTLLMGFILILVPLISYGSVGNLIAEYINYFNFMTSDLPVHGFPSSADHSLIGLDSVLVRVLMDRPFYKDVTANFVSLSPNTTFGIGLFIKATFLGLMIYGQGKLKNLIKTEKDETFYYWAMTAIYWNFIVMINPLAWKHSLVILIFSWVILGLFFLRGLKLTLKEKYLLGFSLSMFLFFSSHMIWGEISRKYFSRFGPHLLGVIALSWLVYYLSKRVLKEEKFLP